VPPNRLAGFYLGKNDPLVRDYYDEVSLTRYLRSMCRNIQRMQDDPTICPGVVAKSIEDLPLSGTSCIYRDPGDHARHYTSRTLKTCARYEDGVGNVSGEISSTL
jgi:hypothetical protein